MRSNPTGLVAIKRNLTAINMDLRSRRSTGATDIVAGSNSVLRTVDGSAGAKNLLDGTEIFNAVTMGDVSNKTLQGIDAFVVRSKSRRYF